MSSAPDIALLNALDPAVYGAKADEHLLEQYKLFVATAEKVSDRRQSTNTYFLTIGSSLLSLLGLLMSVLPNRKPLIIIPLVGIFVSLLWSGLLKSFKRLNGAKFAVVLELETYLPANVFAREWTKLTQNPEFRWKALSDQEAYVPWLFVILNVILIGLLWILPNPAIDKVVQKVQLQEPIEIRLINPAPVNPAPVVPASEPLPQQHRKPKSRRR